MFAKLLKYEWKASAKVFGVLTLAALGMGVLATVILRVLVNYGDNIAATDSPLVLTLVAMGMMLVVSFLAIVLYGVGVQLLLLYRFYKNKFTDEGYLTFTLPVSSHQIFLSSLVNMLAWTVISMAVMVGELILILLFGTATDTVVNPNILSGFGQLADSFSSFIREVFGNASYAASILLQVVSVVSGVITCMTSITLGAVVAKKHKILAAFGIHYAIGAAVSVITAVLSMLPLIMTGLAGGNSEEYYTVNILIQLAVQIILGVGGYFLSTGLMKHKLNLP